MTEFCIFGAIFMDFRDYPWLSIIFRFIMIIHDYPWFSMIIHDFPWLSIIIHNFPWLSIIIHDYPRFSMIIHDYPWLSTTIHNFPWLSQIIPNSIWALSRQGVILCLIIQNYPSFVDYPWLSIICWFWTHIITKNGLSKNRL